VASCDLLVCFLVCEHVGELGDLTCDTLVRNDLDAADAVESLGRSSAGSLESSLSFLPGG